MYQMLGFKDAFTIYIIARGVNDVKTCLKLQYFWLVPLSFTFIELCTSLNNQAQ